MFAIAGPPNFGAQVLEEEEEEFGRQKWWGGHPSQRKYGVEKRGQEGCSAPVRTTGAGGLEER